MRYRSNFNNRRNISFPLAFLILLLVLATAVAIFFIKDYSKIFLLSYLIPLVLILITGKRMPGNIGVIVRILIGLLFVFSGFVKGVDPFGTAYKIEDYLIAYNAPHWFMQFSFVMAICLNLVEFIMGIMLIFNIRIKFTIIITTLMMLFFTATTFVDALTNLVPDCGCFGEFVKMSNWQTFYKNLTIDLLLLMLWFSFYKRKSILTLPAQIGVAIIFGLMFVIFQILNFVNLPMIDVRGWKVGTDMNIKNPKPIEYWVDYANNETGDIITIPVKDIPYDSTEWMEAWTFQSQRIIDNNIYPHNLMLVTNDGIDDTRHIIEMKGKHILIISNDLDEIKLNNPDRFIDLCNYCTDSDYHISLLTASEYDKFEKFIENYNIDAIFYNADDIELKTIIRSNPGIIAMKDGIIKGKWSRFKIPTPEQLESAFNK